MPCKERQNTIKPKVASKICDTHLLKRLFVEIDAKLNDLCRTTASSDRTEARQAG
jgi:hypothetical protein